MVMPSEGMGQSGDIPGVPRAFVSSSTQVGGMSFSSSDVDVGGLKNVVTQLTKIDQLLGQIVGKLQNVGGGFSGGGAAGSPGGSTVTAAGFSGRAATGVIAAGALGEVAARAAGSINRGMNNLQTGGVGLDLMARQNLAISGIGATMGRTTTTTQAFTSFGAMSQRDLNNAVGMMMANPYLNPVGPNRQRNLNSLANFTRGVTGMNPALGASGAMGLANLLTSAQFNTAATRFGYAQTGGTLFNPRTQQLNGNPNEVLGTLLKMISGNPNLTSAQAKKIADNPELWSQRMQNASALGLGLTSADLTVLQQFAAGGMNVGRAQGQIKGSVASALFGQGTAKTALQQQTFEDTAGVQRVTATLQKNTYQIADDFAKAHPSIVAFGAAVSKVTGTILGIVSKVADFVGVPLEAMKGLMGGGAGGAGAAGAAAGEVPLPIGDPVTGSTTTKGLNPKLAGRVSAMMAANPALKISSGHRTGAQQRALYALKGGRGVARPGHSEHQRGNAVDMGPPSQLGWIAKNASKFGLARPAPGQEPWHLQTMGDPVTGAQVVSAAQKWVATPTPYQWGGTGTQPGQGVDCSRFVQEVYASLGISLPRTTYEQCNMGSKVGGIGSAQPGDLIFYNYEGPNSHVAIYIGNMKQIAAPETGQNVQQQNVDTGSITQIRRIVSGGAGQAIASAAQQAVGSSSSAGSTGGGVRTSLVNTFLSQVGGLGGGFGLGGVAVGGGAKTPATTTSGNTAAAPAAGAGGGPAGGNLSASQVYQLAISAGLSPSAARTATAVAKVESSFSSSALDRDSNGTADYGLWQINTVNGGSAALYNPQAAAAKMAAMTNKGQNWAAWGPDFGEGGYGVNPPASGLAGSKVANALASLGAMGDPMSGGAGQYETTPVGVSSGGPSRRGITINMPVQVVGVSSQDAQMLVQMVMHGIRSAEANSSVGGG